MRVLALDTSSPRGSVALVEDGEAVIDETNREPNAHAEKLMPMIERCLAQANWSRAALDAIAVGIGPGSFTGLRVGIALAHGISMGLDIPLIGVPSLEALAHAATTDEETLVFATLDARRDEAFVASFRGGAQVASPEAIAVTELKQHFERCAGGQEYVIAGQIGQLRIGQISGGPTQATSAPRTAFPSAVDIGMLAGNRPPTARVTPLYIRPADAIKPQLPPNPLDAARQPPTPLHNS